MKTKLMIGLTLLAFVLAACGGQTTQPAPEPAALTQAESQPTAVPTSTPVPPTEAAPTAAATEPAPAASTSSVSYANDIKPIFENSCIGCHGRDQTRAGLDLKTYDGLMAGSVNGAVVVAGNPAESWLVKLTAEGKMPKRGDKLTPEQVQLISDWVAAGALNN